MADVRIRFEGESRDAVAAAKDVDQSIKGIDSSAKKSSTGLKALNIVAAATFAGLAIVARAGWDEVAEGQKVMAQTTAVLESTGSAANVTADEVSGLATELSNLSGVDDELIQRGENLLLTFKNIRNEVGQGNRIFDRATQAALDLSIAGFGSIESTSKQLGKALNDPVKGMTALNRAGVTFSEDQKATVKRLVETNRTLDAQKLILREVESQVGGSAKAYGETLPGQLSRARNSFEEMAASLTVALLPALELLADIGNTVFGFLAEHQTTTQVLAGLLITLAGAVLALNVAMKVAAVGTATWTAAQWLLNAALTANPIGVVVVALAALVAGIIVAWRESETFRAIVTGAFDAVRAAAEFVLDFFRTHWKTIAVLISGPFAPIVLLATNAFGVRSALLGAFNAVLDFLRTHWRTIAVLISGPFAPIVALATDAFGVRTALVNAFTATRDFVKGVVDDIVGFFRALPDRLAEFLGPLAGKAIEPMRRLFRSLGDAVDFVGAGIRWLRDNAVKILSTIAEALVGPLGILAKALAPVEALLGSILNFMNQIRDRAGDVVDAIGKVASAAGKIGGALGHIPGFQHGVRNFAGGLAVVGEGGPELVVLPRGSDVIPNSALRSPGGSSSTAGALGAPTLVLHVAGDFIGDRVWVERLAAMLAPEIPRVAMYSAR